VLERARSNLTAKPGLRTSG